MTDVTTAGINLWEYLCGKKGKGKKLTYPNWDTLVNEIQEDLADLYGKDAVDDIEAKNFEKTNPGAGWGYVKVQISDTKSKLTPKNFPFIILWFSKQHFPAESGFYMLAENLGRQAYIDLYDRIDSELGVTATQVAVEDLKNEMEEYENKKKASALIGICKGALKNGGKGLAMGRLKGYSDLHFSGTMAAKIKIDDIKLTCFSQKEIAEMVVEYYSKYDYFFGGPLKYKIKPFLLVAVEENKDESDLLESQELFQYFKEEGVKGGKYFFDVSPGISDPIVKAIEKETDKIVDKQAYKDFNENHLSYVNGYLEDIQALLRPVNGKVDKLSSDSLTELAELIESNEKVFDKAQTVTDFYNELRAETELIKRAGFPVEITKGKKTKRIDIGEQMVATLEATLGIGIQIYALAKIYTAALKKTITNVST